MASFTHTFYAVFLSTNSLNLVAGQALNGALSGDSCPELDSWDEEWTCASNVTYGTPYCDWPWPSVKDAMHRRRRALPEGNYPYPGYKCITEDPSSPNGCVYWGKILQQGQTQYSINYPVPIMDKMCPLEAQTGCRTSPNYPAQYDGWPCGGCYFWVTRWTEGISVEEIEINPTFDSLYVVYGGGNREALFPSMHNAGKQAWTLPETKGSIFVRWEPAVWDHDDGQKHVGWKLCPKDGVVEDCTCNSCLDDPNYRYNDRYACNHENVFHFCNFKTAMGDIVRNACRETCMTCQAESVEAFYPTFSEPFRSASMMDFSYGPAWKESVANWPEAPWARPSQTEWYFGTLASGSRGPPWVSVNAIPGACIPPPAKKLPTAARCLTSAQCQSDWCCPVYKVCLRQGPLLPEGSMQEEWEVWLEDDARPYMNNGVASWITAARMYTGNHGHRSGWFDIATYEKTCAGKAWILGDTFYLGRCSEVLFDDLSHGLVLEDMIVNGKQYYAFNPLHPDCGCKMAFKEAFENNQWTGYFNEQGAFEPLCGNPDENTIDCADGDAVRVREGCEWKAATVKSISGADATVTVGGQDKTVSVQEGIRKQISSPQQDLFCKPRCPGPLPEPWPVRVEPWPEPIPAWYPWPPRHCVYTSLCQSFIEIGQPEYVANCMQSACADYNNGVSSDLYNAWAMEFCPNVCAPYTPGYCDTHNCPKNGTDPEPPPEAATTELPDIEKGNMQACPLQTVTLPSNHELYSTGLSGKTALCAGLGPCPVPGAGKSGGPVHLATSPACEGVVDNPPPPSSSSPSASPSPSPSPSPGAFLAPSPSEPAGSDSEPAGAGVQFSMTFEEMSYTTLTQDQEVLTNFTNTIKDVTASNAGEGITPKDVSVDISEGSVVVKTTITPPAGSQVSPDSLASSISVDSLAEEMVTRVQAVPGIDAAITGTLRVSGVQTPVVVDQEGKILRTAVADCAVRPALLPSLLLLVLVLRLRRLV